FRAYREDLRSRTSPTFAEARYDDLLYVWRHLADSCSVPKVDLPKWNEGGADDYGLARSRWPGSIEKQFAEFEAAARGEACPGQKRRRLLANASMKGCQAALCRYLGYLVKIRKDDLNERSLLDSLADSESVVSYFIWHIDKRCNGI